LRAFESIPTDHEIWDSLVIPFSLYQLSYPLTSSRGGQASRHRSRTAAANGCRLLRRLLHRSLIWRRGLTWPKSRKSHHLVTRRAGMDLATSVRSITRSRPCRWISPELVGAIPCARGEGNNNNCHRDELSMDMSSATKE
jgi:hypothetical protein